MNWAEKRANAVVNSVGYRENPEAAIAAALREVAEEAVKIAEKHADHADAMGDMRLDICASTIATEIRARCPQEEV